MMNRSTVSDSQQKSQAVVSEIRQGLSDEERERHIGSCAYLMLEAHKRYEESSCFGDLAESHRWRILMQAAIQGRSAAKVAKMEEARGLA